MTFTRSSHDIRALGAQLRSWVLDLLAWLLDQLGDGLLRAGVRRLLRREVEQAESDAAALCVSLALMQLEATPLRLCVRSGRWPINIPRGCVRARRRGPDRRALTRRLFPRGATLLARVRRLGRILGALDAHARRVCVYLARIPLDEAPVQRARTPVCAMASSFPMRSARTIPDTS